MLNKVLKLFFNDTVALLWAIIVEIFVHGIFALGALLVGAFLGDLILVHLFGPIGEQVGAIALAIFLFCAAFQAFVLGEYTRDQVKAYERGGKGDGSYFRSWQWNRWIVGGLEIASLLFRSYDSGRMGDTTQAVIIFVFGVLALVYAFLQAKIIHACVNRPASYDAMRTRESLTRDIAIGALDTSGKLKPSEKASFLGGNIGVLDNYRRGREARRQRKEEARQQKEEARQEKQRQKLAGKYQREQERAAREQRETEAQQEGERMVDSLIPKPVYSSFPHAQAQTQASRLSQNGSH
jgi:hypothetical protein